MKKIRANVFETNSSSTHTIDLIDYIWTAICSCYPMEYEEYKEKLEKMLEPYYEEIIFEEPIFDEDFDEDGNINYRYLDSLRSGYIDHEEDLKEFLEDLFDDEYLLIKALRDGYVRTGNDNGEGYQLDEKDDDEENYYHYYKGN